MTDRHALRAAALYVHLRLSTLWYSLKTRLKLYSSTHLY